MGWKFPPLPPLYGRPCTLYTYICMLFVLVQNAGVEVEPSKVFTIQQWIISESTEKSQCVTKVLSCSQVLHQHIVRERLWVWFHLKFYMPVLFIKLVCRNVQHNKSIWRQYTFHIQQVSDSNALYHLLDDISIVLHLASRFFVEIFLYQKQMRAFIIRHFKNVSLFQIVCNEFGKIVF